MPSDVVWHFYTLLPLLGLKPEVRLVLGEKVVRAAISPHLYMCFSACKRSVTYLIKTTATAGTLLSSSGTSVSDVVWHYSSL